jgi:hypothetical protein
MKNSLSLLGGLYGALIYWMLGDSVDARLAGAFGLMVLFVPCAVAGWIIGVVSKRYIDIDGNGADIFSWTILALWIFPPFGIISSSIVSTWSKSSEREMRYFVVSGIALAAALTNAAMGVRADIQSQLCAPDPTKCFLP